MSPPARFRDIAKPLIEALRPKGQTVNYVLTPADAAQRVADHINRDHRAVMLSRPGRPHIVTLCGSTRFKDDINATNARLTLAGYLVISLGVFGHTDMPDHDWTTGGNDTKRMLDDLHRRKIDLADVVYVINPGGYIGESTRGEIAYAESLGLPVEYLVEPGGAA